MWGRFKSRFGWRALAFSVDWAPVLPATTLLVLTRRVAPGVRMAYVPWGPELPQGFPDDAAARAAALSNIAAALKPVLPGRTTFVRFDPPWFNGVGENGSALPPPFRRAAADIQPPDTVVVGLTGPEQEILAAMKPKWRYNTGLAEKRGVEVTLSEDPAADVAGFHRLLTETAERDGIAVHGAGYYRALFDENAVAGGISNLRLYTARHEGDVLAAVVVLFRGEEATYLYGASSNVKRNLMAPYALQWRAMLDAKAAGCTRYDLFGIPPDDDPAHPMAGLYRFKTGFGGSILHRAGSWDYPLSPAVYAAFRLAEGVRKKMRDRRKGRERR